MNLDTGILGRLELHLWKAVNILRGSVDPVDFKAYVFPLLSFKRISDAHDEEYWEALAESAGDDEYALFPQNYRFEIVEGVGRVVVLDEIASNDHTLNIPRYIERKLNHEVLAVEEATQRLRANALAALPPKTNSSDCASVKDF